MRFLLLFIITAPFAQAQDITQFQSFWGYEYYIDGQPISKKEVENKLAIYDGAAADWKRAKQADVMSWCLLSAEMGFALWSVSKISNNKAKSPTGLLAGTVALGAGAIVFQFRRKKLMRQALLSYNQMNNVIKPTIALTDDGLGLRLQF